MTKKTIGIGSFVGVVGILVAILLFAVGNCNEVARRKIELQTTYSTLTQRMQELQDERSATVDRAEAIRNLTVKNNRYIEAVALTAEMDKAILKALYAIDAIGGRDVLLYGDEGRNAWVSTLEDSGFDVDAPLITIMEAISESPIPIKWPVRLLLQSPHHAGQFIDEMRNWKEATDVWIADFFEILLYSFGVDHPKAGGDLKEHLAESLRNYTGAIGRLDGQLADLETERMSAMRLVQSIKIPVYCGVGARIAPSSEGGNLVGLIR